VGALHSSMVGFVIGALFSPEAYQFFPYFAVAYTSALVATLREQEGIAAPVFERAGVRAFAARSGNGLRQRPEAVTLPR